MSAACPPALAGSPLLDDPQGREGLYKEAQVYRQSFGSHVILADPALLAAGLQCPALLSNDDWTA